MSGSTRVSRYQKGKTKKVQTNLDLLEQEIVSGSGICWAICKSAPHPRQPRQHPTTQFFTNRMPFLTPNQQRQSTEGKMVSRERVWNSYMYSGRLRVVVVVEFGLDSCCYRLLNWNLKVLRYKLPDHSIIFARWCQQHKNGQVMLGFATHFEFYQHYQHNMQTTKNYVDHTST